MYPFYDNKWKLLHHYFKSSNYVVETMPNFYLDLFTFVWSHFRYGNSIVRLLADPWNKMRRLISVNISLGFHMQVFHHLQQHIVETLQREKNQCRIQWITTFLGQQTSCIAIRRISVLCRIFKYKYRLIKGTYREHRKTES